MLESFLDPLGKPMQIHEITRKAVAEGIGDKMIGGLTNMLYKSAGVANPLDQTGLQGKPVAGNLRQGAAGEMNKTLLAPLAKEIQKRWAQTVQQLLVKSVDKTTGAPATSAAQIDRTALEKEMHMFMNTLAGFDLSTLAGNDDGSGQAKQLDSELKPQITAAIADTQKPAGASVWLPLATSIQRAKSIRQFAMGAKAAGDAGGASKYLPITPTGQPGKVLVDGRPYNPTDPIHKASVIAAGIDPATLKP
jgi:hypothetical protein